MKRRVTGWRVFQWSIALVFVGYAFTTPVGWQNVAAGIIAGLLARPFWRTP